MQTSTTAADITHQRASQAWKMISATSTEIKYRELIKGVPAMINTSGLLATMAYLDTRSGTNKKAADQAFQHLHECLVQAGLIAEGNLFEQLAAADPAKTRQQSEECIAMLAWLRRFADVQHAEAKS